VELLGEYLSLLADAGVHGRRPKRGSWTLSVCSAGGPPNRASTWCTPCSARSCRPAGGAGPLLDTLDAYFATGGVATESAKRLHVSVRTVTYRLDRVKTLTGYNPTDPAHRFTLQAAVLGAKVLNWPREQLHIPG